MDDEPDHISELSRIAKHFLVHRRRQVILLCVIITGVLIATFDVSVITRDFYENISFSSSTSPLRDSLLSNEAYKRYFPTLSKDEIVQLLTQRLENAISTKPEYSFPPDSVIPTIGRTVEESIVSEGFHHVESTTDRLCISTSNPDKPLCFNTISNAFFTGSGVAIDPKERTVYEISGGCCMFDWPGYLNRTVSLGLSAKLSYRLYENTTILVLCQHHGTTYHHVLYEVLPRFLLSWPIIAADKNIRVAIDTSDISVRLMTHLGLEKERLIQIDPIEKSFWYGAALLLYPPVIVHHENEFPLSHTTQLQAVADILRGSVESNFGNTTDSRGLPILVLMERALARGPEGDCEQNRCVKNFAELHSSLISRLPNFDIQIYGPTEDLSSTVSLFSSAQAVIGIHGAGFQNLVFCQPNTTVIHIGFGHHYKWLSDIVHTEYHGIIVDGIQRGSKNIVLNNTDIVEQIVSIMSKEKEKLP